MLAIANSLLIPVRPVHAHLAELLSFVHLFCRIPFVFFIWLFLFPFLRAFRQSFLRAFRQLFTHMAVMLIWCRTACSLLAGLWLFLRIRSSFSRPVRIFFLVPRSEFDSVIGPLSPRQALVPLLISVISCILVILLCILSGSAFSQVALSGFSYSPFEVGYRRASCICSSETFLFSSLGCNLGTFAFQTRKCVNELFSRALSSPSPLRAVISIMPLYLFCRLLFVFEIIGPPRVL